MFNVRDVPNGDLGGVSTGVFVNCKSAKNLTRSTKRHSWLVYKTVVAVCRDSVYSIIIVNGETATNIDFSKIYRKEFKILLDVFTSAVDNRLQRMVTSLRLFQDTFHWQEKVCKIFHWGNNDIMSWNVFRWAKMFTLRNSNLKKILIFLCIRVSKRLKYFIAISVAHILLS